MDLEDDGSENEMSEDYDGMMGSDDEDGEGGDGDAIDEESEEDGEGDSDEDSGEEERNFLETGVWEKTKKVIFEVPDKLKPKVEGEDEDENMSVVSEEEENYYKKLKEKERKGVSEKVKKFLRKQLSGIGNKVKRKEFVQKRKELKKIVENKARRIRREASKLNPELKQIPVTTEAAKVTDDTYVFQTNEDLEEEERVDEFSEIYEGEKAPKILMTTAEKPTRHIFELMKEIKTMIPNAFYYPRRDFALKDICKFASNRDYTTLLVFRERLKKPWQMIAVNLPYGPTAIYRMSSVKLSKDIFHHGVPTDHYPELILNGFNTTLGRRVGRFLGSMFPVSPEFKGRQAVTFHNARDFIFVRRHRYIFNDEGEQVDLQEIGPRMTLRLKKLIHGVFENRFAKYEWLASDDMYINRKRVYL